MGEYVRITQQMVQVVFCRIPHQQSETRIIWRNGAYDSKGRDNYRDRAPRSSTSHSEANPRRGSHKYRAHSAWS